MMKEISVHEKTTAAAADKIQTAWRSYKKKAKQSLDEELTDPLTLEPIVGRPFYLISHQHPYVTHAFDAKMLAEYFDSTLQFENPCTRERVNRAEVARLARHERVKNASLIKLFDNLPVVQKNLAEEKEFITVLLDTIEDHYETINETISETLEQFFEIAANLARLGSGEKENVGEDSDATTTARDLRVLLVYYASICVLGIDAPSSFAIEFTVKLQRKINTVFEEYDDADILQLEDLDLLCNLSTLLFYDEMLKHLNKYIVLHMFPRLRQLYSRCFSRIVRNPRLDRDGISLHCKAILNSIDKALPAGWEKCGDVGSCDETSNSTSSTYGAIKTKCITLVGQFVLQIRRYYSADAISAARISMNKCSSRFPF